MKRQDHIVFHFKDRKKLLMNLFFQHSLGKYVYQESESYHISRTKGVPITK
jgi:hypothetical protein